MQNNNIDLLKSLNEILKKQNTAILLSFLKDCHPAEVADLIESSAPEVRTEIWSHVEIEQAGEVLKELNEGVLETLIEEIDTQHYGQS